MKSERNHIYNLDCMLGMAEMPDDYIDLAIVDPPYGLGDRICDGGGKLKDRKYIQQYKKNKFDHSVPNDQYFVELERVSNNQIIWGGNYFKLPPTRGVICWDKEQPMPTLSKWEMAWTSFDKTAEIWRGRSQDSFRIHPTQKPVKLYKWLLTNYAKEDDLILDTHMGSGSSYIACLDMSFDYIGYEIDTDYFKAIEERVYHFTRQTSLL